MRLFELGVVRGEARPEFQMSMRYVNSEIVDFADPEGVTEMSFLDLAPKTNDAVAAAPWAGRIPASVGGIVEGRFFGCLADVVASLKSFPLRGSLLLIGRPARIAGSGGLITAPNALYMSA